MGLATFMGGGTLSTRTVVLWADFAKRLGAAALAQEIVQSNHLRLSLLRWTQELIPQVTQTAACNRHHCLQQQQLCRWLLSRLDRLPSIELGATHEGIANPLGVRREGVTECAERLQSA